MKFLDDMGNDRTQYVLDLQKKLEQLTVENQKLKQENQEAQKKGGIPKRIKPSK